MKIVSPHHWPNGRPKKFWNADGTPKKAAPPQAPARPAARPPPPPARAASLGKALPPAPVIRHDDPLQLHREERQEQFERLFGWLKAADDAPGRFTAAQQEARDAVGERVDLLRPYVFA